MSEYAVMPKADYVNLCDAIRAKTGGTEGIKSGEMPAEVVKVYEAGKQANELERWIEYVSPSAWNTYAQYMFAGPHWNKKTFKPPVAIQKSNSMGMFAYHNHDQEPYDLVEQVEKYGGSIDFSKTGAMGNCFQYACVSRIGVINLKTISSQVNTNYTFGSRFIITIDEIVFVEKSFDWHNNMFNGASGLMHLKASGVLANTINFQWCPLTPASMKSVIFVLKNFIGTGKEYTKSIIFNDDCWAALEADSAAPDGGTWKAYVQSLGWDT